MAPNANLTSGLMEDAFLLSLLTDYDRQVRSGAAPREVASVRVKRASAFQNQIAAASGHTFIVDEPETFGGGGKAADPAELLLAAIGASLSVTITAHAALQRLPITELAIDLSTWMSAETFFRPVDGAVAGIQDTVVDVHISSSAGRSEILALLDRASLASPVFRSLADPPGLRLHLNGAA